MVSEHKKVKLTDEFTLGILSDTSAAKLALEYQQSAPYHHCVINPLVDNDLLRKVRIEILNELAFTEKETDIYKVNQTGDLANISRLDEISLSKLESLNRLKSAIYSERFQNFIEKVTGTKGLSKTNIDLSINKYTKGCHLLNHDDVIGTRAVSFILYLPNPDEEWMPEFGGKLELYPVLEKGTPENEPTKIIEPSWNTFAFFAVQPGHSFHSVEEVVAEKDRVSISGWFHFAQPGEEGFVEHIQEEEPSKSTLEQLLSVHSLPSTGYGPMETEELTENEIEYLKKIINPVYLQSSAMTKIEGCFVNESTVQLYSFLREDVAANLESYILAADKKHGSGMSKHGSCVDEDWSCRGPPHLQRYLFLKSSANSVFSGIRELFESIAFKKWLDIITGVNVISSKVEVRRFRPGLDYTLALSNPKPLLDLNLCLTPKNEDWITGEIGGYENYMAPNEDENAAVYSRSNDEGPLLTSAASWNLLSIVYRDQDTLKFVKYVSASAPGSRWDIIGEYMPAEVEDSN